MNEELKLIEQLELGAANVSNARRMAQLEAMAGWEGAVMLRAAAKMRDMLTEISTLEKHLADAMSSVAELQEIEPTLEASSETISAMGKEIGLLKRHAHKSDAQVLLLAAMLKKLTEETGTKSHLIDQAIAEALNGN